MSAKSFMVHNLNAPDKREIPELKENCAHLIVAPTYHNQRA